MPVWATTFNDTVHYCMSALQCLLEEEEKQCNTVELTKRLQEKKYIFCLNLMESLYSVHQQSVLYTLHDGHRLLRSEQSWE